MSSIRIRSTGHILPPRDVPNKHFLEHQFHLPNGDSINMEMDVLTSKFTEITGIKNRRYATEDQQTSDLGAAAARIALDEISFDPEMLDLIIVAHNFGDVRHGNDRSDILPSLASRIKHKLGIKSPTCIPYDLLFGCPGWIEGILQAEWAMRAGKARHALVVGCETLSRMLDPHDRDSMIFADGAGAAVVSYTSQDGMGILGSATWSHTGEEAWYLFEGPSNKPGTDDQMRYIKMNGRKIYEYALTHVPTAMKMALDDAGIHLREIKKIFMHQANAKLDHAVVSRLYKLYGLEHFPESVLPMSVHWLGNSSVATVPTLYDLVRKSEYEGHKINNGDLLLFASVGAGMNINAFVYRYGEEPAK